jgi:hypothetical protein
MNTQQVILQILLGGLLGITGQALRIIIGMKKLGEDANQQQKTVGELIDGSRIFISLLIGFCAGILATITISDFKKELFGNPDTVKQNILAIIAAGYAGTDFIEGLIKKYLPKNVPATVQ